jgi:hypothetical protein
VCVEATLAGATGSPFSQAVTITGSAGGAAPTGVCAADGGAAASSYFTRAYATGRRSTGRSAAPQDRPTIRLQSTP